MKSVSSENSVNLLPDSNKNIITSRRMIKMQRLEDATKHILVEGSTARQGKCLSKGVPRDGEGVMCTFLRFLRVKGNESDTIFSCTVAGPSDKNFVGLTP